MWVVTLELDLLLPDSHSRKDKRAVVRSVVQQARQRFDVAAAETGDLDVLRRTQLGFAVVAADAAHGVEVLEAVERLVLSRPEVELVDRQQRWHGPHDEVD